MHQHQKSPWRCRCAPDTPSKYKWVSWILCLWGLEKLWVNLRQVHMLRPVYIVLCSYSLWTIMSQNIVHHKVVMWVHVTRQKIQFFWNIVHLNTSAAFAPYRECACRLISGFSLSPSSKSPDQSCTFHSLQLASVWSRATTILIAHATQLMSCLCLWNYHRDLLL